MTIIQTSEFIIALLIVFESMFYILFANFLDA